MQLEPDQQYALVIDGMSLAYALGSHVEALRDICLKCSAVLCCRMSPLQKAKVSLFVLFVCLFVCLLGYLFVRLFRITSGGPQRDLFEMFSCTLLQNVSTTESPSDIGVVS